MEKDVVCGMQIDPAKAAGTSEYQGKTYYFCSKSCKSTPIPVRSQSKADRRRAAARRHIAL